MSTADEFFNAIRAGDSDSVRRHLTADPALTTSTGSTGATPVLWAIYCRRPELTDTLLADREPSFFEACALGRSGRVTQLLANEPALASAFSGDGFTGL